LSQQTYQRIVSGADQRLIVRIFRILLGLLSWVYSIIMRCRNRFYDTGTLASEPAAVPVISIGNLTTGGTGKTPLVIWLAKLMHKKGLKCSILTRGYKTQPGQMTDEPAILAKSCPHAAVVVNSDRIAGARKAIDDHHGQVLIMDDGFQHRRLQRDLDIVTIDATCPFGYGKVLPAGFLREPKEGLKRADAVIVTRCDLVSEDELVRLVTEIHQLSPSIPIIQTAHRHTEAVTYESKRVDMETLRAAPAYAFCGIGNPQAFFDSLTANGIQLAGTRTFDDHHDFDADDMNTLITLAKQSGAGSLLCTQKDWVKAATAGDEKDDIVFAYLAMELDFLDGADTIETLIDNLIQPESEMNESK
jgi:tetraacyldisaccharide 4'-kinase